MAKRVWIVCFCVVASWSLGYAQGYRMESDRIVVEGKAQWEQWEYPKDLVEINEEGWMKPRLFRKNINACFDAHRFTYKKRLIEDSYAEEMQIGGPRKAGSNFEGVANLIDGELSTYWEPDENDPLTDWWFEIDLGRLVTATKVVLRFVEEGQGDPFLHFRVWVSSGFRGNYSASYPRSLKFPDNYHTLWKTPHPNEDDRLFEFDLAPFTEESHIQYVRVQVWDTKGDKREELSREEYEGLAPDWRGTIEYYRITAAGEEELTDKEGYEKLSSEQKGPIRYYRRERPRLAEVEVWSLGDNVAIGVLERGGHVEFVDVPGLGLGNIADIFDGNCVTGWNAMSPEEKDQRISVDLGAMFWVHAIHLVTPRGPLKGNWENPPIEGPPPPVRVSDAGIGSLWREVPLDAAFGPYRVRFVEVRFPPPPKGPPDTWVMGIGTIREMQIYGEGYPSDLLLTLDPIEVEEHLALTSVEWIGDTPAGASIEIQTRTGDKVNEEKHYFNQDGIEVPERYWKFKLPSFMRGPVKSVFIPGSDWSFWSLSYEHSGDRFQSPSPKQYLQIRVKLLSDDPYQAPSLKSLSIPFTIPLTERISGMISPREVQRAGIPEVFSLRLHPVFRSFDPGFDQVLVRTSPSVKMELIGVNITQGGRTVALTDSLTVHPTSDDSLWIQFPTVVRFGGPEEIEIRFRSAIYQHGTVFDVLLGNRAIPIAWQQAESEVFHPFLSTFVVGIPTSDRGLMNVEITPRTFSPNGDGVHDELTIRFTLVSIRGPKRPVVTIYDLRGRRVRRLSAYREEAAGAYMLIWDGRNDEGARVPPGVYLVRVEVHTEDASAAQRSSLQPVHVIY